MVSLLADQVDLLITSRPAGNDGWMYLHREGWVERRMFHSTITLGNGTTREMTHYPGIFKVLAGVRPLDRFLASLGVINIPVHSMLGWCIRVCDETGTHTFIVTERLVEEWLHLAQRPHGQEG